MAYYNLSPYDIDMY